VPIHYTQQQRQALLDSAKLAGLSVLALLNENTAGKIIYDK
jgi:molecular chaperone DnaK (HSP70)